MVGVRPIYGTSTDPAEFIAIADDAMEPAVIPAATTTADGRMSAAKVQQLDAATAAIAAETAARIADVGVEEAARIAADAVIQADIDAHENAAAPHSGHATTAQAVTAQATADAAAAAATAAQADIDAHEAAAAPHSGHEVLTAKDQASGYLGVGSDGFVEPSRLAHARSRNVRASRGRIDFVPPLLRARRSILRASNHYYGDETTGTRSSSGHRAGLVAIPPDDAGVPNGPIHPDAGSFPFICLDSSIDFDGYPNYRGKRFHSSNSAQDSGKDGYELGRRIPKGYLLRNQGQRRRVDCKIKNTLADDAFFEFAIEPNHRRGVFNAASRARLLSGPLGFRWTGWYDLEAVLDFRYLAGAIWRASASFKITAPTGEVVWSNAAAALVTSGHNFQTTDTEFLCYQAQVNTWDLVGTYGDYTAQGTTELELVLTASETEPLEACR